MEYFIEVVTSPDEKENRWAPVFISTREISLDLQVDENTKAPALSISIEMKSFAMLFPLKAVQLIVQWSFSLSSASWIQVSDPTAICPSTIKAEKYFDVFICLEITGVIVRSVPIFLIKISPVQSIVIIYSSF